MRASIRVCNSPVAMIFLPVPISSPMSYHSGSVIASSACSKHKRKKKALHPYASVMELASGNASSSTPYFKYGILHLQFYITLCLYQVHSLLVEMLPIQICHFQDAMLYLLLSISSKYVAHQWQSYMYTFFCLFQICCSPVAMLYLLTV